MRLTDEQVRRLRDGVSRARHKEIEALCSDLLEARALSQRRHEALTSLMRELEKLEEIEVEDAEVWTALLTKVRALVAASGGD